MPCKSRQLPVHGAQAYVPQRTATWDITRRNLTDSTPVRQPLVAHQCTRTQSLAHACALWQDGHSEKSGTRENCVLMEFAWWGAYPRTRTISERDSLARSGSHRHSTANTRIEPAIIVARQSVKQTSPPTLGTFRVDACAPPNPLLRHLHIRPLLLEGGDGGVS